MKSLQMCHLVIAVALVAGSVSTPLAQDAGLMLRSTVFSGNPNEITRLAAAEGAVNSPNPAGLTALMIASGVGDVDAVRALLAAGADVKAQTTKERATAMMFAVRFRHPAVVTLLAEKGAAAVTEAASAPEADLKRLLDAARNEN